MLEVVPLSALPVNYLVKQLAFEHFSHVLSHFPYIPTNLSTYTGARAVSLLPAEACLHFLVLWRRQLPKCLLCTFSVVGKGICYAR